MTLNARILEVLGSEPKTAQQVHNAIGAHGAPHTIVERELERMEALGHVVAHDMGTRKNAAPDKEIEVVWGYYVKDAPACLCCGWLASQEIEGASMCLKCFRQAMED